MRSVIVWFTSTERMLSDVIDVVPYEPAHFDVWSPRLVTVLLEACSQLDSLLKHEASQTPAPIRGKIDIVKYFELFGKHLADKWSVFWSDEPTKVHPFEEWRGLASYTKTSYKGRELPWWSAYNDVKHDRILNRKE